MQVQFLGVSRRHGKGKATGNSYDICELHHARPIKAKTTEFYRYYGHGCNEGTFPCDPDCMDEFSALNVGDEIVLQFGQNPENPIRNWVVGFDRS